MHDNTCAKYQTGQPSVCGLNATNTDKAKIERIDGRTNNSTNELFLEDKLSSKRVLTGSLAVGKNWGSRGNSEILSLGNTRHYSPAIYTGLV